MSLLPILLLSLLCPLYNLIFTLNYLSVTMKSFQWYSVLMAYNFIKQNSLSMNCWSINFVLRIAATNGLFSSFWNKVIKFGCVYMHFSAEFIEAQSLFLEPYGLIDLNNPGDLIMIRERIKLPKFKVWVSLPTPKIAESPYLSLTWLSSWYWKKGEAWLWRLQKGMQYLNFK